MMDAIWSGIQRLWDAFINHPDVQALIQGITDAWNWLVPAVTGVVNAIMEFFGITTGGKFDIVHALIMAIGQAWNFITAPIRAVISAVQNVIGAFDQFRNGQMDLPTFIMTILQNLLNVYMSIFGRIIVLVVQWGSRIFSSAVRAVTRFVTGIVTRVRQLPGRVYSALLLVVSRITSAIQSWINAAKSKVQSLISSITSPFSGVAGRISGALSGVTNAITKPFRDAWNMVKPWVDKIKQGLDMIGNIAFGGESAYGGEALDSNGQAFNVSNGQYIVEADNSPIEINDNINLTLDLRNVPSNVNTGQLIEALGDKRVLSALTSNRDFQDLDAKVKQKIALKNVRSRGR
jgi:phage-related protein